MMVLDEIQGNMKVNSAKTFTSVDSKPLNFMD